MPKLRAAIIGTGNIARQHAAGLKAHADRVELVAVHDIDLARAIAFADAHGQLAVFTTAAALFAEARPDLVHICTPPNFHASLAVAAMEAGAHVLCEKPLCASLARARPHPSRRETHRPFLRRRFPDALWFLRPTLPRPPRSAVRQPPHRRRLQHPVVSLPRLLRGPVPR